MESDNNFTAEGVIGNAIHRITLRSIMEIIQSLKNGNSNAMNSSTNIIHKNLMLKKFLLEMQKEISKSIGNILCFQI